MLKRIDIDTLSASVVQIIGQIEVINSIVRPEYELFAKVMPGCKPFDNLGISERIRFTQTLLIHANRNRSPSDAVDP